jgi:hypothetical protein
MPVFSSQRLRIGLLGPTACAFYVCVEKCLLLILIKTTSDYPLGGVGRQPIPVPGGFFLPSRINR